MIYVNSLLYIKCNLIILPFVPLCAEALAAVMLSELISRFTCVCTHITVPAVCVFAPGYAVCVCVCVDVFGFCATFLIWVILGLVGRHYYSAGVLDGRPKRLFTLVTDLNYEPPMLLTQTISSGCASSVDVNVRVDMDVGAKPLTMPTTGQFKRRPQGSKNNLSVIARFAYMSWQQQRLFNV